MMQTGTLLVQRYRIDAKLGEGGMGVVYKAHDTLLNRPVALKSLTPALVGEEGIRRLMREAQSAAQLNHPNIVGVYDVIDDGRSRLIVMEYVHGAPLAELIPLDVPRAIDLALQICRALQYAHGRGVVHRDIKPENILVADGLAKVADFGLARSEGRSRLTQSGLIVGTVAYMAPEQVLGGTVDGRSDLYALGCVLYEALTSRKPFEGDDPFTVLSQQVNVMPVAPRWHNRAIPATLDAIIMRLLAKDPAERYPSAGHVIEALGHVTRAEAAEAVEREAPTTRTTLLERIVRGKLVGRTGEVRELHEHLDRVLSGEGRLVLLSGEPGIGKTRLAEELAVYAHLRGVWVLRGHWDEQDVGVPYLPLMETLRQLYYFSGQTPLADLGEHADDLAPLLPELRPRREVPPVASEEERVRVFEAVARWIAAVSRLRPLVFVFDDLQWADRASLRLLHYLARSVRGDRILLLGTYREVELDLGHPLTDSLSEMNRERLFYRLPLRRLSEEDTRTLLSGLFDADVPQELASAIFRETEGNPFFIEEVVKALVEEGKVDRDGGRWERLEVEQLEIPQSIKAVIGRRCQKASETCRRVLTVAAVIGREFDPDMLVRVSKLDEDTVLNALEEAIRLQLVREVRGTRGARYGFEHTLIRQTLYEGLIARRRAGLHHQVGEALETQHAARLDDHLEELAYHFGQAGPAAASKGVEYGIRTARKAVRLYAMEEAERRLAVALELAEAVEDAGAQVSVHEALGDLCLLSGEGRRASDAYQRALNILEEQGEKASEHVVRLHCGIAEASAVWWTEETPEAAISANTAVNLLRDKPDSPLKARASALLAIHQVRAGDFPSARAHAEQAIDIAGRLGARYELSMGYRAMAMVHRYSNEWDRLRDVVLKRRDLLSGTFTAQDADLYVDLLQSYLAGGNPGKAMKAGREFLELAEKLRSPALIYRACLYLSNALFLGNRCDEAMDVADRAVGLGERLGGAVGLSGMPGGVLGTLYAIRDETRARDLITRLEIRAYDPAFEHAGPRQAALMTSLILGDKDLLRRILPLIDSEQPRCGTCAFLFHLEVGHARLLLGDIAGAQAKIAEAQLIAPATLPYYAPGGVPYLQGLVAEAAGDLDAAAQHLEEAVQGMSGRPMDYYQAVHLEDAGRVYLARGKPQDLERGRRLLAEAIEIYETLGAKRFEARARNLLEAVKGQ